MNELIDDDQINVKYKLNNINMNAERNTHCKCINDIAMIINFDCKFDSDFSTAFNDDSDNNFNIIYKNDSDNDFSLMYHTDNDDCDINDNCDVEFKKTRAFLYRHFIIVIAFNEIFKKFNMIFMKVTLLHIKDEDNNSRM